MAQKQKGADMTPAQAAFCTEHLEQSREFDCEPLITQQKLFHHQTVTLI